MKRYPSFILLLLAPALGIFLMNPHPASADAAAERVVTLSSSGYEQAHTLAFSSNGGTLAVGGTAGIYLYNPEQLTPAGFIQTESWARSVAFLPGSQTLAAGLYDGTIRFWDLPRAELSGMLDGPRGWIRSISLTADGSLIASASDDDTVRVWRFGYRSPILTLHRNTAGVRAVALSPDGKLLAGADGDNTVRVWSLPTGELLYTLNGHSDWVRCLAFSLDGALLASGSFDKTVRLWDMADGRLYRTLEGHTASVLGVTFSPDGKMLASGSVDQTVRLWNTGDGSALNILQGHTGFVYAVAFSPDGKTLASGGADNAVRLWDVENLPEPVPGAVGPETPSDCQQCHHRRGQVEPARVIGLNCEGCHAGGIGLAFCAGFARSNSMEPAPVHFSPVSDPSGVPSGGEGIAVVIASPGNGETLYVKGNFMAPEVISGKVFHARQESASSIKVQLEIISEGHTAAALVTTPKQNGEFNFNVAINPNSPPPHLSKPATRQCLVCHGDFVPDAGLPLGDVHLVVTAVDSNGKQASDDRWIHVDASGGASLAVQVIDKETQQPLPDLSIKATTILYEWRDRFAEAKSSLEGEAQLMLEALGQAPTPYSLTVPPQVVNGVLYASPAPMALTLPAGANAHSGIVLAVEAAQGQIHGNFGGAGEAGSLQGTQVWAVQLPAGPTYSTSTTSGDIFEFKNIPVSRYVIVPDMSALAARSLYAPAYYTDLINSPMTNASFSLSKGRPVAGKILAQDGSSIPFAWITIGKNRQAQTIDPSSGKFLIPDFPPSESFLTILAPGYYSVPQSVTDSTSPFEFRLTAKPETRRLAWGAGELVIPGETAATLRDLEVDLETGWMWGDGGDASHPLQIHLPGLDINIPDGRFALESPANDMGWLYVHAGEAQVVYAGKDSPMEIQAGQMIALRQGAQPISMEPTVIAALHPVLADPPVQQVIEPSPAAQARTWLVQAGIGAAQIITFITYILSLVALITIPMIVLFWKRKKRRILSDSQERQPHATHRH